MALALGLLKKFAPLLLKECRTVKEEFNEMKSNLLHSEIVGLLKKLVSPLLKDGKFVLAYKEELNELESNLHSVQAFLEDADHHQNSPSMAPLKRVIMEYVNRLVSDAVRFLESLNDDDDRDHHHRGRRGNVVVKSSIKYQSVVLNLNHHYRRGRRLCGLNQRFKDIHYKIHVYLSILLHRQELNNIAQQVNNEQNKLNNIAQQFNNELLLRQKIKFCTRSTMSRREAKPIFN